MEDLKITKLLPHLFLFVFLIICVVGLFNLTNQDCEKNPPRTCYYTSNNIIDNNYTDCKTIQYEKDNLIFPDIKRRESCLHNGDRIEVEFKETKYECGVSNLTSDYRFCS